MNDFTILLKKTVKVQNPRIVISKKVAKLAVDRNRIKRLFRNALREIGLSGEITVIVKKNIADYKISQIKEELEKFLKN